MNANVYALVNLFVELLVVGPSFFGNFCEYFEAFLQKVLLDHTRRGHIGDAFASDVINVDLVLPHAVDVLLQADLFVTTL